MAFLKQGTLHKPNVQFYSVRFSPPIASDGLTEYITFTATDHESQLQEEARRCFRQQKRYWDYKDNKMVVLNSSYTKMNGYNGRKVSVLDRDTFMTCFFDLQLLKTKLMEEAKILIDEWNKQPKTAQKVTIMKEYPIKDYAIIKPYRHNGKKVKSIQTLILTTWQYTTDYLSEGATIGPLTPQKLNVYIKIQTNGNGMTEYSASKTANGLNYDAFGFGVGFQTFLDMISSPIFEDFRRRVNGWTASKLINHPYAPDRHTLLEDNPHSSPSQNTRKSAKKTESDAGLNSRRHSNKMVKQDPRLVMQGIDEIDTIEEEEDESNNDNTRKVFN